MIMVAAAWFLSKFPMVVPSSQEKSRMCWLSICFTFENMTAGDDTKIMIRMPRMKRASLRTRNRPRLPRMFFQRISAGSAAALAIKIDF